MAQGLLITIPIGTNEGIITNVFVRIFSARIYPTGQATDINVYPYKSLSDFQQGAQPLIISKLPPVINFPSLPITAFNNVPNVQDFIYGVLEAAIEAVTGPGTVTIVP